MSRRLMGIRHTAGWRPMRELVLRILVADLESLGLGRFVVICRQLDAHRLEMLSCHNDSQKWLVRANTALDESDLVGVDCVNDVELLYNERGQYEYMFFLERLDSALLGSACPREVTCEGKVLSERDFAEFVFVAPETEIEAFNRRLNESNVTFELVRIGKYEQKDQFLDSLTGRQRKIITTAYERGYYDVPRSVSLDSIAESSDLDKSTVSEHLRRAERNILKEILS